MAHKVHGWIVLVCLMMAGLLAAKGDSMTVQKAAFSPDGELYALVSAHSAPETVKRVKAILAEKQIPVFAEFDHARNAREVNMALRPATVIVFGSPAVGTLLMQENPAVAAVLPLKILVWEDSSGVTRVGFVRMELLAGRYGLENHPVTSKMKILLESIVAKAVSRELAK